MIGLSLNGVYFLLTAIIVIIVMGGLWSYSYITKSKNWYRFYKISKIYTFIACAYIVCLIIYGLYSETSNLATSKELENMEGLLAFSFIIFSTIFGIKTYLSSEPQKIKFAKTYISVAKILTLGTFILLGGFLILEI